MLLQALRGTSLRRITTVVSDKPQTYKGKNDESGEPEALKARHREKRKEYWRGSAARRTGATRIEMPSKPGMEP